MHYFVHYDNGVLKNHLLTPESYKVKKNCPAPIRSKASLSPDTIVLCSSKFSNNILKVLIPSIIADTKARFQAEAQHTED